jgi:hypothetical protein
MQMIYLLEKVDRHEKENAGSPKHKKGSFH